MSVVAFVTAACGDGHRSARVIVRAPDTTTSSTVKITRHTNAEATRRWYAAARRNAEIALWIKNAETAPAKVRAAQGHASDRPAAVSAPAGSCEALVAAAFPTDTAWALHVAHRESGCTAGAVNNEGCDTSGRTNSHALGVFQMCYPLHLADFVAVGCNEPLVAECNIAAAAHLYARAGRGPWGG